jgi:hypothetical protein
VGALLRDDKREDLSRTFRLYARFPTTGLPPIARLFEKHIEAEGMALVRMLVEALEKKEAGNKEEG